VRSADLALPASATGPSGSPPETHASEGPLVSVIVPAHNAARYLPAALASVLAQAYRPVDIVVVDDGSTDGTSELIRTHPEARYVRLANARGPAAARNEGIRQAKGSYIAFLDADDLWPPNKLGRQVAFLEAHPDVALLFGNARRFSDDGWTEPSLFERYRYTAAFFGHEWRVVDPLAKLVRENFIPTGTVLARKDCLEEAGLFDERFLRAEDWDLWLRVALRCELAYSAEVWKLKRVHSANLSGNLPAMVSDGLAVLEKLRSATPADGAAGPGGVVRLLANGYRNLGYLHLRALEPAAARRALRRSLTLEPRLRTAVYLAATYVGAGPLALVFRIRG
jgi:GT2 family glycosyltransferase